MAKHNKKGRSTRALSPFLALENYLLDCPAWTSLTPVERCTYIEVARLYNGSNNGRISMSGRRLAERLHVSKASGTRALKVLVEKGFLEVVTPSAFSCKTRRATEYRLTVHKCDVTGKLPFKAFMRWQPAKNKTRRHGKPITAPSQAQQPLYCK